MLKDVALAQAASGRFVLVWDAGDVVLDSTETHAVASQLLERRGQWIGDASGDHGSRLHTLRMLGARAPSEARSAALEALQPLVDAGRIAGAGAEARRGAGGRLDLSVRWTTPDGDQHLTRI